MNGGNPEQRTPTPFSRQLDTDGRLHDIAPEHERLHLVEPAPEQLL
jgi:hypothetical protein